MSTTYDPATGRFAIDWTPDLAAFAAHLEATFGPVKRDAVKAPTPEALRGESLIAIVYRLVEWGKTMPANWQDLDAEARLALAVLLEDGQGALDAHASRFKEEALA